MKTHKKSVLNEGYYYEQNSWYEKCPDELPLKDFNTEIFTESMTHEKILKRYGIVPYGSYEEAAAVCASIIPAIKNDYKSRIVYFKENETLYRFSAWRDGGGEFRVYVFEVDLSYKYDAEGGVCFSNGNLDTSGSLNLSDFEALKKRVERVEDILEKIKEAWVTK